MITLTESDTPMTNWVNPDLNICIVKENVDIGKKTWLYTHNIVTDDGDLYYAQMAAGDSSITSDFGGSNGRMELRTGSATPAKDDVYSDVATPVTASRKGIDTGYPKTNDSGDADNTGDGLDIVTWRTYWATTDFNATGIVGGCIHVGGASPASGTKLLTHYSITSFDKTASDTLKIFVNHTFTGV